MMGLVRIIPPLVAISVLMGCTTLERLSGKERLEKAKPNPLQKIDASVSVRRDWIYNLGTNQTSHSQLVPAMQGDALYAASSGGKVVAVDARTGKALWSSDVQSPISGAVGVGFDSVLVGTPDGMVIGLDLKTGEQLWSKQLSSEILAPPAADSGVAVVRTIDGHVYGLSTSDGEQKWVFHRQVPTLTLRGNSPPLVIRGAVVAGFANGKIVAADLVDGTVLWDISVAQPRGRNEVERMIDIDSTPILVGSVLYVSAFQGAVIALALGSRNILWSREISSYGHINADDNNIFISDEDGVVWALDRLTGEVKWTQDELLNRSLSGPTAVGKYLTVGDYDGYLHVLRKTDGKIVGRRSLGNSGLAGTPIVDGGNIYSMTNGGDLVSISLSE